MDAHATAAPEHWPSPADHPGKIKLVNELDHAVATLSFAGRDPEQALTVAVGQWRASGARGGYVLAEDGTVLAQHWGY